MQITTTSQDNFIRWFLAAGAYFICLIAFYIDIGQDMGAKYFMPILVPVIAALILMQYGSRIPLFSKAALPNLLTGLLWCAAFPLLYTWTYEQGWYMSLICYDFLIGTALFVLLTSLESSLFRLGWHKTIAAFMALLNFIGIVVPLIQFIYYCTVWHCLSPASLMALYLTNYHESLDYIQSNIGSTEVIDAFLEPIWKETVPEMETVSSVVLTTVDDYTTTIQLMTYMAAGEADIYFLSEQYFKSYAGQGGFLPLEGLVADGTINVSDIDLTKGYVAFIEEYDDQNLPVRTSTHLFGIPLQSFYGFMNGMQIDNRDLYAVITVNNQNDANVIPFFNALLEAGRGEQEDWMTEQTAPDNPEKSVV